MRRLGKKKITRPVTTKGHQNCGTCHPDAKGGRSFEKRLTDKDIQDQLEDTKDK